MAPRPIRRLISYLAILVGLCDFSDMPRLILQCLHEAAMNIIEAAVAHDNDLIPIADNCAPGNR